jgi:hypothetical protein
MAIALTVTAPAPGPGPRWAAVCAAGRWVTHGEWPGWQAPCGEPGEHAWRPPYLLCYWHAWDLAERNQAEAGP